MSAKSQRSIQRGGMGGFFRRSMMEAPAEERDHEGNQRRAEQRVGEAAMVLKGNQRPAKAPEDVEVGRFGGECHGQRGVRGFAVEAGAAEACAGEEMGDWFHRFVMDAWRSREEYSYALHLYNP